MLNERMKDLSTYIAEARTLKDLKGKRVGKIEVGDDNLVWEKAFSNWATINDLGGLEKEDMDDMYEVYVVKGSLYVCFEYDRHMWYMEFRHAPGHRTSVHAYKDDVHVHNMTFSYGQENFIDFWYQLPKILKVN